MIACLNLSKDADTSFLDPLFNREVWDWDDENETWDRPWRRHHSSNSNNEVHVLTTKNLRSRKVTVMKMTEPNKQKKSRKRKSGNSMKIIEESERIEDSIEKLPLTKPKRKRRKTLTYSKKKRTTHYASNKEGENLDEFKKEEKDEVCLKENNTQNDKSHPKLVKEQETAEIIHGQRNQEENTNMEMAMVREEKMIERDQNTDGRKENEQCCTTTDSSPNNVNEEDEEEKRIERDQNTDGRKVKISNAIPPQIVPQMM